MWHNFQIINQCYNLSIVSENAGRMLFQVLAHLNKEQAITSRDSLAKAIYAKTFDWLVKRVNTALASTEKSRSAVIGLLDIYGFEVFEQNGSLFTTTPLFVSATYFFFNFIHCRF